MASLERFDDALHVIPEMLDMIGWAELATDLGFGMAGTRGEPKFSLLAQEAGEARKWGCYHKAGTTAEPPESSGRPRKILHHDVERIITRPKGSWHRTSSEQEDAET
ncbi:hypothetical protein AK812_SmicGene33760 [Symbiodinium microadriaticum]|uniref:Uncharacterized protein n=1 Tax=Symbiodinium microadriaticum TaxID=2951 RepID=A0A1Q9CQR7_SYMMI|nr:hypothetical protein AK812_SmicGene33760 [Symbiodinium microadriaticum]